ncbi:cytochrome P450 [Rhodococcoides fascians]|uniref:cytochrome P450 n=1 Tax=Rhodococcoides fascians TaxID=1828 RepID=UPI00050CF17D|nr:cytochrome P450 [Rhodococcus fascians]
MNAAPTGTPTIEFDHHSPEYARNWVSVYDNLRARCPVGRSTSHEGFYVLSRYEDVAAAIADDDTFSSAHDLDDASPFGGIIIPPSPQIACPVEMDPPEFQDFRKTLNPLFAPRYSKSWEPFVRDVTTAMINQVVEKGALDLIHDLASPVPALLTAKLLGVPLQDWRKYSDMSHRMVYVPRTSPEFLEVVEGLGGILEEVNAIVQERRIMPQDDLISKLTQATVNGQQLDDTRILEICHLVIAGGNDTTTALLSNAFSWLQEHPAEMDWLREDPSRLPTACEEFLRYFTPTQGLARTVTRDVDFAGHKFTRGDRVLLAFASANRDPEAFDDPDEVILDRFPNRHQAFGLGIHRCLGSNYARMTFVVIMEEVFHRLDGLDIDLSAAHRYESIGIVNGWVDMPATFTPGIKIDSEFEHEFF